MNLRFLIILAYYKRPNMVLNALHSIANLTYDNWHLAFIDDSGDDSFKDTLLNYGLDNSKVTYIPTYDTDEYKKSIGGSRHGHFMNEAIETISSDVYIILCDDDALVPTYLTDLNTFYQNNPTCSWAYSKVYFFDPSIEYYFNGSATPSIVHPGSTYTLNMYDEPIIPMGKVDSSQITFRTQAFLDNNIQYAYPQTRGLDSYIFGKFIECCGLCQPTGVFGQYKGAFPDQLGNRFASDNSSEFSIQNH